MTGSKKPSVVPRKKAESTAASERSRRNTASRPAITAPDAVANVQTTDDNSSDGSDTSSSVGGTPTTQAPARRSAGRTITTVPTPARYNHPFSALLSSNNAIKDVQASRHWKPQTDGVPFPYMKKLAYIARIRQAIINNINALQFTGPFSKGEFSMEDIEYAAHLIWDSVEHLHRYGIVLHAQADPTRSRNGHINYDQRDLAPKERLAIIIAALALHKKLCQDVLKAATTTELIQMLVAAPTVAFSTRVENAKMYDTRHHGDSSNSAEAAKALLTRCLQNTFLDDAAEDRLMGRLMANFPTFDYTATTSTAFYLLAEEHGRATALPPNIGDSTFSNGSSFGGNMSAAHANVQAPAMSSALVPQHGMQPFQPNANATYTGYGLPHQANNMPLLVPRSAGPATGYTPHSQS